MHRLAQDLKYALRNLAGTPGFTAVALVTLALGIGANTAIFTAVNEVLMRPRPGLGHPERLVDIGRSQDGRGFDNMSYPNFRDYRERAQTLSGVAALMIEPRPVSLQTRDGAERIYAGLVSGSYFDVLRVEPHIGRFFLPEEDLTPGSHPVVVLSHSYWLKRFGGDAGMVGREIRLNGLAYTVVGVTAPAFHGTTPLAMDAWIPLMMTPQVLSARDLLECRACSFIVAIGRLKPGISTDQARAEAETIGANLAREYPEDNRGRGLTVSTSRLFPGEMTSVIGAFLGLLMAIVGLVLAIASVNVAGMMLVRASGRRREIAVRLALGARPGTIAVQFMAEGILLFLGGGAGGVLVAFWMRNALLALLPALPVPISVDLSLDWRVVTFAIAVSLAAGVAAALVPATQALRPDMLAALKDDSRSSGLRRMRLRAALVLGQVALSLVLLICAGLFLRALHRASRVDPGFDMEGLQVLSLDLSLGGLEEAEGLEFANRLLERVRALPAVASAAWSWSVPLDGGGRGLGALQVPGRRTPGGGEFWDADWSVVTPGYFAAMKIPLLRGRDFGGQDTKAATRVAIINETAARALWPGEDAIGRTFRAGHPRDPSTMETLEVIGVVRDQKYRSLGDRPRNFVFVPLSQRYIGRLALMVRTPSPGAALPAIRAALREEKPNLPILSVLSMHDYAALSMFPQKIAGWVSGSLGLLGLLLVGLGIYGVAAFSVAQRTREIGIRMALGAERSNVIALVLREGLRLAAWGVAVGLAISAAAAQLLASLLYGISTLDPGTFGGIAALVLAVAAAASLIPARRATRVDPVVSLRCD
jgi:predicted permease